MMPGTTTLASILVGIGQMSQRMAILHDDLRSGAYAEPGRWDGERHLKRLERSARADIR